MVSEPVLNAKLLLNYLSECNDNYFPDLRPVEALKYREHILNVITRISEALKRNNADYHTFVNGALEKIWRLEIIWFLSADNLLDFPTYLCKKDDLLSNDIANDLANLYLSKAQTTFKREMQGEMAKLLLKYCEKEKNMNSYIIHIFCRAVYDGIKRLEGQMNSTGDFSLIDIVTQNDTSLSNLLVKIVLSSFCDCGQSIRDAIGSPVYYRPNQSLTVLGCFEKIVQRVNKLELFENSLVDFFINCKSDAIINWSNVSLLVHILIKNTWYSGIKTVILKLTDYSLNESSSFQLYTVIVIGRICCLPTAALNLTYLQWFSSTFSCDSHRPLCTVQKAQFFLKSMSEIVYVEPPEYLKVHIHKVASVPSCCQAELSEYLQQARACLISKNESIEMGFFDPMEGLTTAESDVKCLIQQFKTSAKIPQSFLASLNFRRQYYERKFLPKLLSSCEGKSSSHHAVIKCLSSLGKIPKDIFNKHLEKCS